MILIYASPNFWSSYAQRAHHCVNCLTGTGKIKTIWIEPYPTRLPHWSDLKRSGNIHNQGTTINKHIKRLQPRALPIEPVPGGSLLNQVLFWEKQINYLKSLVPDNIPICLGVGKPSRFALLLLDRFNPSFSFYDAMDDFPNFYSGLSRYSMAKTERQIAQRVDKVFYSSHFLENKFKFKGNSITLIPNACTPPESTFHPSNKYQHGRIAGYIGTMGDWFDWDLVIEVANDPQIAKVELVGPVFTPPANDLPGNITISPPCPQKDVYKILDGFDFGFIPFMVNDLTNCVDPIKYYEYRSVGLPIISSYFGEMRLHKHNDTGIFTASRGNVSDAIRQASEHHDGIEAINEFRTKNSWHNRFTPISDWLLS